MTSFLRKLSHRTSFPYTVALLIVGFLCQFLQHYLPFGVELSLSPDIIFFIFLPLLLFEAAMHIHIHQFRLQFKTITFLATFGLMVSVFTIGFLLFSFLGVPFSVALLFGAIISATDPIAVLSIFRSLGAPKRLALLADGESMFNDATAVVVFRLIAAFAVEQKVFEAGNLFEGAFHFIIIFFGSIALGVVFGYATSSFIKRIKDDLLAETTLTIGLALGSFVVAEHVLHLSGVIATVMAGLTLGNLGKTSISSTVVESMKKLWEYISFIAISIVFFFAAFNLSLSDLFKEPFELVIVIGVILLARALSVYLSFFLTNTFSFFSDEPSVPLAWQHVVDWGGFCGVIPLVLVYSLPNTFLYKEELLRLTLVVFLFTLFVNGTTIKRLLLKLHLHLPRRDEEIIHEEDTIFKIETARKRLRSLGTFFDRHVIQEKDSRLRGETDEHKDHFLELANPDDLLRSLRFEALRVERESVQSLLDREYISGGVFYDFEADLDLQQDALEYPEVSTCETITSMGRRMSRRSLRKGLSAFRYWLLQTPFLRPLFPHIKKNLVEERFFLLKTRIYSSYKALDYLHHVKDVVGEHEECLSAIDVVIKDQQELIEKNKKQIRKMKKYYSEIFDVSQRELIRSLVWDEKRSKVV